MSTPKYEPDYASLWQGYQMQTQDIQAARERELATSRMRLSMAGLTPDSENWQKSMNDIGARYDKEIDTVRTGAGYDQLKTGFSQTLTAVLRNPNQDRINTREYGTEGNPEWEKARERDNEMRQSFAEKLGVSAPDLSRLQSIATAENGVRWEPVDGQLGYRPVAITAEDKQFFDETMSRHYSTAYGDKDFTAPSKDEAAIDTAKRAASGGGMGGRKRGASGGGGMEASPNAGGSGLMNPLAEDEEKPNPWI